MPDWNSLRRRARAQHCKLRAHLPVDAPLLPAAEALLAAAAAETGIEAYPLAASDPLLAGAHAVLDRSTACIWYAEEDVGGTARQRFARAHEYAHLWLHSNLEEDACAVEDLPGEYVTPASGLPGAQVAEGYSGKERRETEANLFASELLLPSPILRRLFVEGWTASQFVEHTGLSETCVLAQLSTALLLPAAFDAEMLISEEVAARPAVPLDTSQCQAAQAPLGPVLVDAGPGTGKTRTLVARLVWLLQEQGVAPENILALTFSNQAADEMRVRLLDAVGAMADRVWIGTFHAFGYEILRKDGARIGLPPAPSLLDTADAVLLLEQHLDRLYLEEFEYLFRPALPFPDILQCISRAKDELTSPSDYFELARRQLAAAGEDPKQRRAARKSLEIAGIYAVYQQLLAERGLLDFGDLLMRAVELLDACPDVQARWQQQYTHLLADEYQDINRASALLVQRLAGDGKGFWAVGDLRQAIYRFRGASPANVREFGTDFPGGRRLQLEHNYRSAPTLVDLFGQFAGQMAGSAEAAAWRPHRSNPDAPAITLAIADDEEAQADCLVALIRDYRSNGIQLNDQAILCHTNRQASDLAAYLEQRGIPAQHLGGLFDRSEVKDMLALLSLACEPHGATLARVAQFSCYAIPMEDVQRLLLAAREQQRSFPTALTLAEELTELSDQGRNGLRRLYSDLQPLLYRGDAWAFLCRYLFDSGDYLRLLMADDSITASQQRLALHQLLLVAERAAQRPPDPAQTQQSAFLAYLRHLLTCGQEKAIRVPSGAYDLEGVRLMTIHQSKGLEFPVVYLPNLVEGQFPPRKGSRMAAPLEALSASNKMLPSLANAREEGTEQKGRRGEGEKGSEQINRQSTIDNRQSDSSFSEEDGEDCLFFVALSRARDHLVLSRPPTWKQKPAKPSRMLAAVEPALDALQVQRLAWHNAEGERGRRGEGETKTSIAVQHLPLSTSSNASGESDNAAVSDVGALLAAPSSLNSHVSNLTSKISPSALPVYSASALEQYQKCPRRFYYERILRLPEQEQDATYLAFHQCINRTLEWLHSEQAEGRAPDFPKILSRFASHWETVVPSPQSARARVLRTRAEEMLAMAPQTASRPTRPPQARRELVAKLENGSVRLTCDQAEELPDGTLRLVDFSTQRPSDDDHTEPRLALLRHAARQMDEARPVQVVINYLHTGEHKEVKEAKRWEPARVEKYNIALQGVRSGHFEPDPEPRKCAICPYFFICPA